MKLYQYLTEGKAKEIEYVDADKESEKIYKECKKYYSLIKTKPPLLRAINQKILSSNSYFKKQARMNRKSRLSRNIKFWDMMNEILDEMGHNGRDASVPVTANPSHARIFSGRTGQIFYFLPIGNFSYSWAPTNDFNYQKGNWNIDDIFDDIRFLLLSKKEFNKSDEEIMKEIEEKFRKLFKLVTTDKGFDKAYNNNFEIWFNCKEYYLIPIVSELGGLLK